MLKLGFNTRCVNLIMACIKSVSFSIVLNGQSYSLIVPERGFRQGDLFSPYLFLLVTKGLHTLFKKAEDNDVIRGVSLCATRSQISHLLFMDDSLVFCRATILECVQIQSLLHVYEQASGQSLNKGKTNIFFNSNTLPKTREAIATFLGVLINQQYKQYLGLPSLVGHSKKKSSSLIKERIWKKLKGWKEKLLSQVVRKILITTVIQAIPTYTMLCLKLPKGLISESETLIRKFW